MSELNMFHYAEWDLLTSQVCIAGPYLQSVTGEHPGITHYNNRRIMTYIHLDLLTIRVLDRWIISLDPDISNKLRCKMVSSCNGN